MDSENRKDVSRRAFVRRIVGGTGALLPGMQILGSGLGSLAFAAGANIEAILSVEADATLSAETPLVNAGNAPELALVTNGTLTSFDLVVQFSRSEVLDALNLGFGGGGVHLVLTSSQVLTWGAFEEVTCHALVGRFDEATVTHQNCPPHLPNSGAGFTHIPGQVGDVAWDVSNDLMGGAASMAWRITIQQAWIPCSATYYSRQTPFITWHPRLVFLQQGSDPLPTPGLSPSPSPTPSHTPLPSLSHTPLPSPSNTPRPTPLPSVSAVALTPTPMPPTPTPSLSTVWPTPTPSSSRAPTPTRTSSPTPTPTMTPTPSPSASLTPTPTPSVSLTPTPTQTPSATPSPSPSATPAPSPSAPPVSRKPGPPDHVPPRPSLPPHPLGKPRGFEKDKPNKP